jgi:hypothetical protein
MISGRRQIRPEKERPDTPRQDRPLDRALEEPESRNGKLHHCAQQAALKDRAAPRCLRVLGSRLEYRSARDALWVGQLGTLFDEDAPHRDHEEYAQPTARHRNQGRRPVVELAPHTDQDERRDSKENPRCKRFAGRRRRLNLVRLEYAAVPQDPTQ